MDIDLYLELYAATWRGVIAQALLNHGGQPTASQLETLRAEEPTVRDISELFFECGVELDFSTCLRTDRAVGHENI